MPTPAEVLQDPKFQGLPVTERRKVLSKLDPNFDKLAPPEQDKVLGMGKSSIRPSSMLEVAKDQFNKFKAHPLDALNENNAGVSSVDTASSDIMLGGAEAGEVPGASAVKAGAERAGTFAKAFAAPKPGGRLARAIDAVKDSGKAKELPFNPKTAEFVKGPEAAKAAEAAPKPTAAPTSRAVRSTVDKQAQSEDIANLQRHAKTIPLAEQAIKDGVSSKDLLALSDAAKQNFMKAIGLEGRSESTWKTLIGHIQRLEKSK